MLAESGDLFGHDQVIGTTYPTSKSIGDWPTCSTRGMQRNSLNPEPASGCSTLLWDSSTSERWWGHRVPVGPGKRGGSQGRDGKGGPPGPEPANSHYGRGIRGCGHGKRHLALSKDKNRKSLAMKEKDGMQIALMNLGAMSKLYLEKKSFAELYVEKIEEYDIQHRYYSRIDKTLFEESLIGEAREKAKTIATRPRITRGRFQGFDPEEVPAEARTLCRNWWEKESGFPRSRESSGPGTGPTSTSGPCGSS